MTGAVSKRVLAVVCFLSLLVGAWTTQSNRPPLFIVPRVDGTVSAFEAITGKPLWNFSTGGPLVQSSAPNSHEPVVSPTELSIFNAIQRDGLQDLYPEANTILGATPFMSSDGAIFLSQKHSKLFGLDPITGNAVPTEMQPPTEDAPLFTWELEKECADTLHIVRTEHTLETHNGSSTRFLTVSHIRVFLKDCTKEENAEPVGLPLLTTTQLGDLQALDAEGNPLWIFDLPVPHSQLVYGLTANSLRAIRPEFPVEPLQKVPLSLTNYKGTPFELSYGIPELTKTLALPAPIDSYDNHRKSIWYWIATICVCTTATVWGLIILKYQNKRTAPDPLPVRDYTPTPTPSPSTSMFIPRSESTLRLREEHELLRIQLHKLQQLQEQQKQEHLQQTQQLQELQLFQQEQLQQSRLRTSGNDLLNSLSRYRADFEEKQRLGEGGFGTVFLAINKLDGVEYAVKKVCLSPGNRNVNERVLREVRHLAVLDHPNIIRYFQSWIEEDEWDERESDSVLGDYEDVERVEDDEEDEDPMQKERSSEREEDEESDAGSEMDYEGDESRIGGSSLDDDTSESSCNLRKSAGLRSSSDKVSLPDLEASTCSSLADSIDKKVFGLNGITNKTGKLGLAQLDVTFERDYGSTSNPISSDESKRGCLENTVKNRKLILYIQMQYCHQGTLHHWLSRSGREVRPQEAVAIFRQAVRGVAHIHSHSVIHRDIKPPNILISADGSVKIGDFGLSTGSAAGGGALLTPVRAHSHLRSDHTTGVGSPLYCSPEQLNGERYDSKVDIFSLGIILYEMWHIFSTQMERVTHITQLREGKICTQTKELYPELTELVLRLVHVNPDHRPPASEILAHPLLSFSIN